jgi:hypothetical protein
VTPARVNRLEVGHVSEPNDCAITALANYLGLDYTDVIRLAARLTDDGGKGGLTVRTIRQIAALCGAALTIRSVFDPEEAYGIVILQWSGHREAHAAVLREGWVQDRNLVYDWDDWLAHMRPIVKPRRSGKPRALTSRLLVVKE